MLKPCKCDMHDRAVLANELWDIISKYKGGE